MVYEISVDTREKTTANRRESALRAKKIGFAIPHFRKPAVQSCSSLIGIVRANPVAAPAAPDSNFSPPFSLKNSLNISFRRCRGTDRICPNGPDEGTSRSWLKDTTSESEVQHIRFASPEGRIRADSRLVLSHVSTPSTTLPKLDWE